MKAIKTLVAVAVTLLANAAQADITIGISLPLTGPASGLGIPMANYIKIWPTSIAGEKLHVIVLDDATDPTKGVTNAKKFITEDKADIVMGSAATPVAIAMSGPIAESETLHFAFSPAVLPAGKDHWMFRLPQGNAVMAYAMIEHMKKQGVKTVGFLGYTDAYGESWLNDFKAQSQALGGPQIVAAERFARSDTSVTAQALKLSSANPDAMLIVASGSGAAMPHKAIVERGFKGKIYQTHAAASRDLVRVGGKDVEGAFVTSGPAVIPEQLPANHPSKALAADFVAKYEKAYGPGSRNQFARPCLRRDRGAREDRAGGAEEGQAGQQGVPGGAARCGRDHGPYRRVARRAELHQGQPLGLHDRDRRDPEGRQRRLESGISDGLHDRQHPDAGRCHQRCGVCAAGPGHGAGVRRHAGDLHPAG